ncbi:LysR substrate-binding domain-containing protein [Pigmentiphaga litoralis]|uniref:Molybdate transport repressor ModE-like protein n=1 Tax=Pigmentiphaga litoralis TaxID=516702 RepID=A0A7Y9IZW2_9BURK|nr:LysR substrate-binding domain-containing protein [Pigmentiphaga litoralis]NYE26512.1 molybdate transport repressor ModE-like protein [Pigmentiphaga litoralis]NYE86077.1 molybdate transport repressor ModE-like protein [Pigmentiphaga litoralis]
MQLNLHLLRIFHRVALRQSFSRASEDLFISQPAVSKAVRELEHLLELPLIERGAGGPRGSKGVRLTESGAALFDHARGIFALERAAVEDIDLRIKLRRGTLTLGASTTIASYWLPPTLGRFAESYPLASPRVVVGNTHEVVEQLLDCRVDLALVEGHVDDPRIDVAHWRDDEMVIVVPMDFAARCDLPAEEGAHGDTGRRKNAHGDTGPRDASATADLSSAEPFAAPIEPLRHARWIVREEGSGTGEASAAQLAALDIVPQERLEVGSNEAIARMVAAGMGVAILPRVAIEDLVALKRLAILSVTPGRPLLRPLYRLTLRDRPKSPVAASFEALLDA